MASPCPDPGLDGRGHDELARHRAKVFDALSRHSDPALREIGRQLAGGAVAPQGPARRTAVRRRAATRMPNQLAAMNSDDLHRRVFGVPTTGRTGPAGDPDDREGGVPAVRR